MLSSKISRNYSTRFQKPFQKTISEPFRHKNFREPTMLLLLFLFLDHVLVAISTQDFVLADGIKISKLDLNPAADEKRQYAALYKSEERLLEFQLELKDKKLLKENFPTTCQVCRLFVEELYHFLYKNGEVEKKREGKHPVFKKNGNVIYRALQEVCVEMKNFKITRIRPFRYVRGGAPLREMFREAQKGSPVKHWMYNVPESELDDPTGEIRRLQSKCDNFLAEEEDRIISWFFKAQAEDPLNWLCRQRVLKKTNKDCLDESTEVKAEFQKIIQENVKSTR